MKLKFLPLFLSVMPVQQVMSQGKPNILFIFADDMTVDALDAIMSEREVISPNLDRLRESGTFFTHAFNQGSWSGAVSAASRAMLTTGRYLWNACNRQPDNPNFARQDRKSVV